MLRHSTFCPYASTAVSRGLKRAHNLDLSNLRKCAMSKIVAHEKLSSIYSIESSRFNHKVVLHFKQMTTEWLGSNLTYARTMVQHCQGTKAVLTAELGSMFYSTGFHRDSSRRTQTATIITNERVCAYQHNARVWLSAPITTTTYSRSSKKNTYRTLTIKSAYQMPEMWKTQALESRMS